MKRNTLLFALLALLLVSLVLNGCQGCDGGGQSAVSTDLPTSQPDVQTDFTEAPKATDAPVLPDETLAPGVTAAPTPTPTPMPTEFVPGEPIVQPTPAATMPPSDQVVTGLAWIGVGSPVSCDMDMDGKPEKIELNSASGSVNIRITVGASGKTLTESLPAESFVCALLNDFASGDGRVELIISGQTGSRDYDTLVCRLNRGSDGLEKKSFDGFAKEVYGDSLLVARLLDVMGTWECVSAFGFHTDTFEFIQNNPMWTVVRVNERWCTVKQDILVCYYTSGPDNEVGFLTEGCRLYPTSTDMETLVNVTLDTGARGYFDVTADGHGRLIYSDRELSYWFSDLYFIN